MYQLVSDHFLCVKVCDEKADVIALDLLSPQDDKVLCTPHHESHEHLAQQGVDVVQLLHKLIHALRQLGGGREMEVELYVGRRRDMHCLQRLASRAVREQVVARARVALPGEGGS